ncbi:terminase family protein [Hyphomonadaceae bacterium ML37]|nr:terminase family protein [Hyphomonadaceae bacterium ML37]
MTLSQDPSSKARILEEVRAGKKPPEAYLYDWSQWAWDPQLPPAGDWRIWLFLGGRGAGKTRAGAEWVRARVAAGARRIALVGPAFQDVREVMLGGPSGLLSVGYPHERPAYQASRRRVVWPDGAVGYAFSAEDPDGLRGPQFDAAWADEFAAWARPQETLDMLRLGLRLGADPRLVITTTPRAIPAVKALIGAPGVAMTRLATGENRANLAPGFVEAMEAQYAGSHLARQELDGVLVEDPEGALWTRALIEQALRADRPEPDRIVVAVDPPAGDGSGDACGIIVAGAAGEGRAARALVLADWSLRAGPEAWAARVAQAFEAYDADSVVAEANQGGDMVRAVLQAASRDLPVRLVRASRGKRARAEPAAALYAAGRVAHAGRFTALEDQMCAFGAPGPRASPDRVDALVWALAALLGGGAEPRLRGM